MTNKPLNYPQKILRAGGSTMFHRSFLEALPQALCLPCAMPSCGTKRSNPGRRGGQGDWACLKVGWNYPETQPFIGKTTCENT